MSINDINKTHSNDKNTDLSIDEYLHNFFFALKIYIL